MEQPTALAEELETAQPNGPTNEFKTCWAGPEKELGFGLAAKSRKLPPCWEDLHPEAQGALLHQANNYLENYVLLKQRTL